MGRHQQEDCVVSYIRFPSPPGRKAMTRVFLSDISHLSDGLGQCSGVPPNLSLRSDTIWRLLFQKKTLAMTVAFALNSAPRPLFGTFGSLFGSCNDHSPWASLNGRKKLRRKMVELKQCYWTICRLSFLASQISLEEEEL
jgi:hypothetical protein